MRRYLIGEVCAALGVKPHVLRYWEQQIGMLTPAKNRAGRRVYSPADLQTLFRVKYLVHHRLFTLEGAAQRILEESSGRSADAKARIQELRQELLDLLGKLRESAPPPETASTLAAVHAPRNRQAEDAYVRPQIEFFSRGFDRRSPEERNALLLSERLWAESAEIRDFVRKLRGRSAAQSHKIRVPIVRKRDLAAPGAGSAPSRSLHGEEQQSSTDGKRNAGRRMEVAAYVQGGSAACSVQLVIYPPHAPTAAGTAQSSGGKSSEAASAFAVTQENGSALALRLERQLRERYSLTASVRCRVYDSRARLWIPHLSSDDGPLLRNRFRLSAYWSPLLALLHTLSAAAQPEVILLLSSVQAETVTSEALGRLTLLALSGYDAVALATAEEAERNCTVRGAITVRGDALSSLHDRVAPLVRSRTVEQLITGVEKDDKESVEVREYRVTPTAILKAARKPIVLQDSTETRR